MNVMKNCDDEVTGQDHTFFSKSNLNFCMMLILIFNTKLEIISLIVAGTNWPASAIFSIHNEVSKSLVPSSQYFVNINP